MLSNIDEYGIIKTVLIPYQELSGYYDKVVHRKALTLRFGGASSFVLKKMDIYVII